MTHDNEQPKKRQAKEKSQRPKAGNHRKDPIDYPSYPYPSMKRFAEFLVLRYDSSRTRHSYYRDLRLIQEHFDGDPADFTEEQLRNYILFVKTGKEWKAKTIRQSAASAKLFFVEMLGHHDWEIFSQIRTKDHEELPEVLSRDEVKALLSHVRLRRYRIPLKLIYCCGLRISECLSLTIHDIRGKDGKLWVRGGKGGRDRLVPVASTMIEDLRRYWSVHQNKLLLFPNVGRGPCHPGHIAQRMHGSSTPMPVGSLQRLMIVARRELKLLALTDQDVTFQWKDRNNHDAIRTETIPGTEFVRRYLLHVLPRGMRSIRYFGFCHPAAKKRRERVAFHTGRPLLIGPFIPDPTPTHTMLCPCCDQPMIRIASVSLHRPRTRGPPVLLPR